MPQNPLPYVLAALLFLQPVAVRANEAAFVTEAKQAILVDVTTGTQLFAKDAQAVVQPGNFAKLMTFAVAAKDIKEGKTTLETLLPVTEYAWRTGGGPSRASSMFVPLKAHISVQDLMIGIGVVAANDGALVLAEGLAEGESVFVARMNQFGSDMGLQRTHFVNPTGLPADSQFTTPQDLVVLAQRLMHDFPESYAFFKQPDITWSKITQRNRNPLLGSYDGVDGLMINFIPNAGHGALIVAQRQDRRLLALVLGLKDRTALIKAARHILDWGFDGFETKTLFREGEAITRATVYGGAKNAVPLISAKGAVQVFLPKDHASKIRTVFDYTGPLKAPVAKGTTVGTLSIWRDDILQLQVPLVAHEDVAEGSMFQRALDAVWELGVRSGSTLMGWIRS